MSGTFRDLKCWQKAVDLSVAIYRLTLRFPKEEMFGLTSQLRRASVSILSNIAEGKGRSSEKELLRFLANARGSLFEVEAQIILAERLGYVTQENVATLGSITSETGKMINGLIKAIDPEKSKSTAA